MPGGDGRKKRRRVDKSEADADDGLKSANDAPVREAYTFFY